MSTNLLKRRLDRLRLAGAARPVVVEMAEGETLAQVRKRARAKHGDLGGRNFVIIERTTGAKDGQK
ncbi:MAG TPA: hypothetical protein VIR76_05850 [Pusillimonas sp.]